jgi:hypothetical protein
VALAPPEERSLRMTGDAIVRAIIAGIGIAGGAAHRKV